MISEDEDNQNVELVQSNEADEQLKSSSHNNINEASDMSQDNQISKNESQMQKSDSEQQVLPQPAQQTFLANESDKLFIKFPKPSKKRTQFGTIASLENKSSQSLEAIYPWLSEKTLAIENPLIKLHNEIIDYYLAFQEQQQIHNELLFAFNKFQGILFKTFKNCDVLAPFLTSKVYLKNSQVQIFILFDSSSWKSPETIEKIRQCLEKINFEQIKYFESQAQKGKQEKVGFNCVMPQKGYQFQIKLATKQWLSYLSMISDTLENNLEGKYLYLIFDTMIRQRMLQNSIKGYLLFGMIAVFIQERRRQRNRSLTQNLLKFLEYFGMGPLDERRIVYAGRGDFDITVQPSQHGNPPPFSFWISPNIDISNHSVKQFFGLMKNRYRLISNFNFTKCESILWPLLNPAQDEFRY